VTIGFVQAVEQGPDPTPAERTAAALGLPIPGMRVFDYMSVPPFGPGVVEGASKYETRHFVVKYDGGDRWRHPIDSWGVNVFPFLEER